MTSENMIKVIEAANTGNYQIVCRAIAGSIDSWYITLVDPSDWNWSFNEYRIYVGTKEPPMTNKMNEYSVYFCGYTYYFIDNDGKVKEITNVNFTQSGAQYTSFLRCHLIESDNIRANETGLVSINDDTKVDGNLEVTGDITLDSGLNVSGDTTLCGNTTIDGDLTVKGNTTQVNTVVETLNYKRIEVDSTNDVSLGSADTDSILIGAKSGENLGIDANELQARNNGTASTLYINENGGELNSCPIVVNGNSTHHSYNESLRLNRENATSWATIALGGAKGTVEGTDDSTWCIGTPPSNSKNPLELVINRNGSSGANCASFYKDSNNNTGLHLSGALLVDNPVSVTNMFSVQNNFGGFGNIILSGDSTYGSSGVIFTSKKGNGTNINQPSDGAAICYRPYGLGEVETGESSKLVISVMNDDDDQIIFDTPDNDVLHYRNGSATTVLDTKNCTSIIIDIAHPIGSTYIQYPEQKSPNDLFEGTSWSEVNPALYCSSTDDTTANLGTMSVWVREK